MILAIDPGSTHSAYAYCSDNLKPLLIDKVTNEEMLDVVHSLVERDRIVIEMIASYGMPVGAEVFDTCVWIGRFVQVAYYRGYKTQYIYRNEVKHNLCHSSKANDATIKQALVDRFAKGVRNYGKGTKNEPGWFYGFSADIWSAYAVAVTYADKKEMGK